MESCKWGPCDAVVPKRSAVRVVVRVDGAPLVAYACSDEHAEYLRQQLTTGDRFAVDPLVAMVGNGRLAA